MLLEVYVLTQDSRFRRSILGLELDDEMPLEAAIEEIYSEIKLQRPQLFGQHRWWNLYTKDYDCWEHNSSNDPWELLVQPEEGEFELGELLWSLDVVCEHKDFFSARILAIGVPFEPKLDLQPAEHLVALVDQVIRETELPEEHCCIPALHYSIELGISVGYWDEDDDLEDLEEIEVRLAEAHLCDKVRALGLATQTSPACITTWDDWDEFQFYCNAVLQLNRRICFGKHKIIEQIGPLSTWKPLLGSGSGCDWQAFKKLANDRKKLLDKPLDDLVKYIAGPQKKTKRKPKKARPSKPCPKPAISPEPAEPKKCRPKPVISPEPAEPVPTEQQVFDAMITATLERGLPPADPDPPLEAAMKRIEDAWTNAPAKRIQLSPKIWHAIAKSCAIK